MINRISIMSSIYVSVSAKISMIKGKVTTKSRIKIFVNTRGGTGMKNQELVRY